MMRISDHSYAANEAGKKIVLLEARGYNTLRAIRELLERASTNYGSPLASVDVSRSMIVSGLMAQGTVAAYPNEPRTYTIKLSNDFDQFNPILVDFRFTDFGLYFPRVAFADGTPLTGDFFTARHHAS